MTTFDSKLRKLGSIIKQAQSQDDSFNVDVCPRPDYNNMAVQKKGTYYYPCCGGSVNGQFQNRCEYYKNVGNPFDNKKKCDYNK